MRTAERDPAGGVLGFAIAFLAFAFGSVLPVPAYVRLLAIGVGVLLAVRSAGMTGFGLGALVIGGITLVGLVGPIVRGSPLGPPALPGIEVDRSPTVDDNTQPQEEGGYVLRPHDRKIVEASWSRRPRAEQRATCAVIRDGVSDAEMPALLRELVIQGIDFGGEWQVRARAMLEYLALENC